MRGVSALGVVLVLFVAPAFAEVGEGPTGQLRVGFGQSDITPPVGATMTGASHVRSVGTDDPLLARTLVAQSGERTIAIVGVDLVKIRLDLADAAIAQASQRTGIDRDAVMICCSHNHSSPLIPMGGPTNKDYLSALPGLIADSIEQAYGALQPARMFLGDSGSMLIGLILGALAIRSSLKGPATVALAAPTAVWAVLILDVSMAIVRRKLTGRSIYTTDRSHLHHTLLQKGFSGKRIVIWVGLLCVFCSAGALASISYQNDFLAIGSALAVVGAMVMTGFFGHSECALMFRSTKAFLVSILRLPSGGHQQAAPMTSRLHGNREWDSLWDALRVYAERFDLCLVQLNVNLPALHEEYHAVWKRKHGSDHDQMWHATLPLICDDQVIGRLRLAGLAAKDEACSRRMAELIEGLKPFEEQVQELAASPSVSGLDEVVEPPRKRSPGRKALAATVAPNVPIS